MVILHNARALPATYRNLSLTYPAPKDPAVQHFSFGALTPALAYAMSCVGSLLGLQCTARARLLAGGPRARWLMAGALAIGGTGIWVMHFIAMLGYSINGVVIRYDVPLTLLSAVIAIGFVGCGLFIAGGQGSRSVGRLLLSGLITGGGVATMHYTGMAAISVNATIDYDIDVVALSVLIAIVAATAALWAALHLKSAWTNTIAALIMGVAISSMHYTGMLAMNVGHVDADAPAPSGAEGMHFLVPIILGLSVSTICVLTALAVAPSRDETRREAELMRQLGRDYGNRRV
jgi:NO-binding membrane sensor protein with MHYT domain